MLPSRGNPEFGETRKIEGYDYQLEQAFTGPNELNNIQRSKALASELKQNWASVRILKNSYGSRAVYVREALSDTGKLD